MRRNAVLFVLISLCSGFGSTAMSVAANLWILDLTGSASLAVLAALGVYAPALAAPWLGALVDRLPRRPLLITIDLLVSAAILVLLAAPSAGAIYVVLLFRGLSYVLLDAGESALLPAALPPRLLGDVNGWRASAQEGMKLLAPLAGAALYTWRGAPAVVLVCAALPIATAVLYAVVKLRPAIPAPDADIRAPTPVPGAEVRAPAPAPPPGADVRAPAPAPPPGADVRAPAPAPATRAGTGEPAADRPAPGPPDGPDGPDGPDAAGRAVTLGWGSVRAGLAALWREPLRTPVLVAAAAIAASGLTNAAVLLHLVDGLHRPAGYLGILSSAQGAGSILGGLLFGRLLARLGAARVAALGGALFAAACLCWSLPWWPGMVAGSVLAGLGLPWTLIAGVTAIQTGTPDHLLGRVSATGNMVMFGPINLAIPLGSALAQVGARPPLLLAAVLSLVAALVAGSRPRRGEPTG
ncbi:MFS transporter [Actinoplanes teichomyceticus]|uniref:MFS transporter n=1 Tax=Actinoplanes teichomyceticus TaxID=1867 RepID=A0A561WIV7_ACTTI|nr:MFS transporter [Actinoplanes teichomyceticus]TWG23829.1 MFS transporter [Actinoplanes teichomyceticus]GIF11873.1 hypothetical protein Ate01nite_19050 [Actinoplanes teichomyceticus]